MTAEVTQLALAVDSTQVNAGAAALDRLAASGTKAESATDRLEAAMRDAGTATAATATQAKSATQNVQSLFTGLQSAGQTTASALQRASAASRGVAESTARVTSEQNAQAKAARLAAMQTQQLGFQLNDFFVQVASGGNPLTAAIQQGSQLSGVYGGLGAAVRAVTGLFTVSRVVIGGVVGAVGSLALAAYQGAEQSNALQRALVLTGNAAGITEGQFNSLAATVADATKTTIGSSRDSLQALVATGRFSGDALRSAATATQLLAKVTGASTDDIVKNFVTLSGGVAKGAQSLNEQYNFLTAAQLKQIRTLEEQGRTQQAVALTLDSLNERLSVASKNVGTLESAWTAAKNAVSGYIDAAQKIGREATVEDEIARISTLLGDAKRQAAQFKQSGGGLIDILLGNRAAGRVEELEQVLAKLRESKDLNDQVAKATAESAQREQARVKFNNELEGTYGRQAQLAREIARINGLADASGASAGERAQLLAAAIERLEPGIAAAKLQAQVGNVQRALSVLTSSYAAAESLLEANRAANLISESSYYDARRALIQASTQTQVKALQDENAALSAFQRAQAGKLSQAEVLGNQQKIAANAARITALTTEAATKTAVLTTQQSAAAVQFTRQYEELSVAQRSYLDNLERSQQLELGGAGLGNAERQRLSARQRIEDEFSSRRDSLNARKRSGVFDQRPDDYARELQLLQDTLGQALNSFDAYQTAKVQGEQNASAGMREAIANYASEAQNVAGATAAAFTNGFRSIEDSIVNFVTTGKGNFKSLITSILAEALRLQAVRPLLNSAIGALAGMFGSGGGVALGASDGAGGIFDGRAIGGPVSARGVYRVNERGAPEVATFGGKSYLLTGNQSGSVTPAQTSAPMSPININVAGDVGAQNMRAIRNSIAMAEARRMRQAQTTG